MFSIVFILAIVAGILLISIRQVNQYQRGLRLTLGKFRGIMKPEWSLVLPIIQSYQKVDIRTKAVDVPDQSAITRDNV